MNQFLVGALLTIGGPAILMIVSVLMAKFMVVEKLTTLLIGVFIAAEKGLSLFGARLGAKGDEELAELTLGTAYLSLRNACQNRIDAMKKRDTDGDFKA